MRKVWLVADSVISPLGTTSQQNFNQILSGASGIKPIQDKSLGEKAVCVSRCELKVMPGVTRFETLAIQALEELKNQVTLPESQTLFILSTTKGNIEVLESGQANHAHIDLHAVAGVLAKEVNAEKHIVVSNACTSGVVALIVAKRYIENGDFDHAIVLGADVLTRFVISGFQSLNALSVNPCKPFDAARRGINLGEAASAILLTTKPELFKSPYRVSILGGAMSNDANHISGPSKTGEELASAIQQTLTETHLKPGDIDFISAHGTATLYNDEMESKAFYLSNLSRTPVHSLKGNVGHTLGAAGVLEAAMTVQSLVNQELIPSRGFETLGVSQPLNVTRLRERKSMRTALKTSSGFGGCNAAIILQQEH